MTERMDMSLDDIISTNKTSHRGRGRGRGSRGGNRGRRNFRDNNSDKMELGSGYNKTEEGTGGAFRRQRIGKKVNKPYAKKEENGTNDEDMKGDEDTWKHDLFEQQEEGKDPNVEFPRGNNLSLETGTKIRVENLEYTVSESDLQELFGSVGTVKKAKVHYDRSGRSKGSADIIFTTKNDAESAVSKYNGVTLDGKAMKITLLGSALAAKLGTFTVSTSRGGQRRVLSNRSVIRGGRGGRGRGNNRR